MRDGRWWGLRCGSDVARLYPDDDRVRILAGLRRDGRHGGGMSMMSVIASISVTGSHSSVLVACGAARS